MQLNRPIRAPKVLLANAINDLDAESIRSAIDHGLDLIMFSEVISEIENQSEITNQKISLLVATKILLNSGYRHPESINEMSMHLALFCKFDLFIDFGKKNNWDECMLPHSQSLLRSESFGDTVKSKLTDPNSKIYRQKIFQEYFNFLSNPPNYDSEVLIVTMIDRLDFLTENSDEMPIGQFISDLILLTVLQIHITNAMFCVLDIDYQIQFPNEITYVKSKFKSNANFHTKMTNFINQIHPNNNLFKVPMAPYIMILENVYDIRKIVQTILADYQIDAIIKCVNAIDHDRNYNMGPKEIIQSLVVEFMMAPDLSEYLY